MPTVRPASPAGQVDYIEAHGTGTLLGDPIEAAALGSVLAEGRVPGTRCALGSVKTNLGHLEAAAGIAGLIKTALALHHRAIPPSLNFTEPNPHIPFDQLPLHVQRSSNPGPPEIAPGWRASAHLDSAARMHMWFWKVGRIDHRKSRPQMASLCRRLSSCRCRPDHRPHCARWPRAFATLLPGLTGMRILPTLRTRRP